MPTLNPYKILEKKNAVMRGNHISKPTPNMNIYLKPLQQIFERENVVM